MCSEIPCREIAHIGYSRRKADVQKAMKDMKKMIENQRKAGREERKKRREESPALMMNLPLRAPNKKCVLFLSFVTIS